MRPSALRPQQTPPREPELAGPFAARSARRSPPAGSRRSCWLVWVLVSFVAASFARDLQDIVVGEWPLGYWMAAQGAVLVFIAIVVVYAWAMSRFERQDAQVAIVPHRPKGAPRPSSAVADQARRRRRCALPAWLGLTAVLRLVRAGGAGLSGTHGLGREPGACRATGSVRFSFPHRDGVRRHRRVWPHVRFRRVLRGRPAHTAHVQRHGGRRRLDERGLVRSACSGALYLQGFSGTSGRPAGWPTCSGWTGRVLSGGDADCTAPAGHGAVHRARFFPCALWRALAAHHCSAGGGAVLALPTWWRRSTACGLIASRLTGVQFEIGIMLRPGWRAAVLVPGRHACHHLDAGGAVRGVCCWRF